MNLYVYMSADTTNKRKCISLRLISQQICCLQNQYEVQNKAVGDNDGLYLHIRQVHDMQNEERKKNSFPAFEVTPFFGTSSKTTIKDESWFEEMELRKEYDFEEDMFISISLKSELVVKVDRCKSLEFKFYVSKRDEYVAIRIHERESNVFNKLTGKTMLVSAKFWKKTFQNPMWLKWEDGHVAMGTGVQTLKNVLINYSWQPKRTIRRVTVQVLRFGRGQRNVNLKI